MCSLQEAYQIPSFSTAVKKKCSAARTAADPYDPFSPEMGRGERAAAQIRDNFVGGMRDNVAYKSQATDNDFYCRTYGVCTTPETRTIPKPNPDAPTTGRIVEGFTSAAPTGTCKLGSNSAPLRYEYPMSPEAKEAYDRALKLSLSMDERATATAPIQAEMRTADLTDLKGYEDEDLDKYLQTKDMKAAPISIPTTVAAVPPGREAQPYDPKDSPFAKAIQHFSKEENKVPQVIKENMAAADPASASATSAAAAVLGLGTNKDSIWDIVVFVLVGLLVIFLCDQLFRLGVMMGMRKTVELLEPFLEKA